MVKPVQRGVMRCESLNGRLRVPLRHTFINWVSLSSVIKCVFNHWAVEISKILFFDRMPAVFLS